jgi:ribose transport system permease protein
VNKVIRFFQADLTAVALPLVVLLFVLVFSSEGFLSAYNTISVLQSVSIFVLIGLAQMSTLALGQLNLAVGGMGCLTAILMGFFMEVLGMPVLPALIIGLGVAMVLGAVQGLLVAYSGINPFIITLALLSVYTGTATVITMGKSYNKLPDAIKMINRMQYGIVPLTFIIAFLICTATFILYRYTDIGRRLQAVGESSRAAEFSGIRVSYAVITGHTLSGLFAGSAAFIQMCRFNSAQLAIGGDWMLTSFVVAVLGGTLLSGGKFSVVGTLLGSFMMVFINNALGLWKVNPYIFQTIMGMLLLVAFEIDRIRVFLTSRGR